VAPAFEAGLKALNIAPGLFRKKFGFEGWRVLTNSYGRRRKPKLAKYLKAPISGSDRDPNVLIKRSNAERCGIQHQITFAQTELSR